MKRTLLSIFILSVVLLFNSCDTPLNEYKPKSVVVKRKRTQV
jgi:hypothetical protein